MHNGKVLSILAVFLLCLAVSSPAMGEYVLIRDILSTAGGQASSTSYLLGYSVGQTAVGYSQGQSHAEWAGFWGSGPWGQPTLAPQDEHNAATPQNYLLHQNYPNPFNPRTHIAYQLPQAGPVSLCIYNVRGQLVTRLIDEYQSSGEHAVTWDGRDGYGAQVASGIYFCHLTAGSFQAVRKMMLIK
jgi:hypothetical protein